MTHVAVTVNGAPREADVEPRTLLVYFLRETLGLTGTNVGCDTSSCGSCTVLLDGESVKSCTLLAAQVDGRSVTTIEGLASNGDMHPLQEAFHRNHGLQCGYCTPGMLMAAASYLKENPSPTEQEVRESLEGNLCRCTGYQNIVKSILDAAGSMSGAQGLGGLDGRNRELRRFIRPPQGRRQAADGSGHVRRQPNDGGDGVDGAGPSAVRARADRPHRHVGRRVDARRDRRAHGGRPGGRVPLRPADGLADHRGHQGADPLAADEGQDPVRRGRRGGRRRRDPRAGGGCGRGRRRRGHRARGRPRSRGGGEGRGRDPRGSGHEQGRALESRRCR